MEDDQKMIAYQGFIILHNVSTFYFTNHNGYAHNNMGYRKQACCSD